VLAVGVGSVVVAATGAVSLDVAGGADVLAVTLAWNETTVYNESQVSQVESQIEAIRLVLFFINYNYSSIR
jgi:hypothetical protein